MQNSKTTQNNLKQSNNIQQAEKAFKQNINQIFTKTTQKDPKQSQQIIETKEVKPAQSTHYINNELKFKQQKQQIQQQQPQQDLQPKQTDLQQQYHARYDQLIHHSINGQSLEFTQKVEVAQPIDQQQQQLINPHEFTNRLQTIQHLLEVQLQNEDKVDWKFDPPPPPRNEKDDAGIQKYQEFTQKFKQSHQNYFQVNQQKLQNNVNVSQPKKQINRAEIMQKLIQSQKEQQPVQQTKVVEEDLCTFEFNFLPLLSNPNDAEIMKLYKQLFDKQILIHNQLIMMNKNTFEVKQRKQQLQVADQLNKKYVQAFRTIVNIFQEKECPLPFFFDKQPNELQDEIRSCLDEMQLKQTPRSYLLGNFKATGQGNNLNVQINTFVTQNKWGFWSSEKLSALNKLLRRICKNAIAETSLRFIEKRFNDLDQNKAIEFANLLVENVFKASMFSNYIMQKDKIQIGHFAVEGMITITCGEEAKDIQPEATAQSILKECRQQVKEHTNPETKAQEKKKDGPKSVQEIKKEMEEQKKKQAEEQKKAQDKKEEIRLQKEAQKAKEQKEVFEVKENCEIADQKQQEQQQLNLGQQLVKVEPQVQNLKEENETMKTQVNELQLENEIQNQPITETQQLQQMIDLQNQDGKQLQIIEQIEIDQVEKIEQEIAKQEVIPPPQVEVPSVQPEAKEYLPQPAPKESLLVEKVQVKQIKLENDVKNEALPPPPQVQNIQQEIKEQFQFQPMQAEENLQKVEQVNLVEAQLQFQDQSDPQPKATQTRVQTQPFQQESENLIQIPEIQNPNDVPYSPIEKVNEEQRIASPKPNRKGQKKRSNKHSLSSKQEDSEVLSVQDGLQQQQYVQLDQLEQEGQEGVEVKGVDGGAEKLPPLQALQTMETLEGEK